MRFIHAAQSSVGRVVQGALGGWLLIEGAAQGSLAGLVMMMTGVLLAVTGLAGLGVREHKNRRPSLKEALMFDLITGHARHMPRNQSVPILVSTTAQVVLVGLALVIPYLYVTEQLPEIPTMMAFVAAPPPPPPPPSPPPPTPAPRAAAKPAPVPPKPGQLVAPVEAPPIVAPELVAASGDDEEGVVGGVEGGVPGGVYGGVVGGIPEPLPPPPPPPPPAQPRGPVRVGGQLKVPELVKRVDPEYPQIAMAAQYEGLVILEAVVNEDGRVDEVRVLRSAGLAGALDRAAVIAVRQWQYSPLLLNGRRTPFVVTVTLSFTISDRK